MALMTHAGRRRSRYEVNGGSPNVTIDGTEIVDYRCAPSSNAPIASSRPAVPSLRPVAAWGPGPCTPSRCTPCSVNVSRVPGLSPSSDGSRTIVVIDVDAWTPSSHMS